MELQKEADGKNNFGLLMLSQRISVKYLNGIGLNGN